MVGGQLNFRAGKKTQSWRQKTQLWGFESELWGFESQLWGFDSQLWGKKTQLWALSGGKNLTLATKVELSSNHP